MASLSPDTPPTKTVAVFGGGPAGLRAAEVAAEAGARVTLFEAQSAVGRKLLIAGKSGLNITNSEGVESLFPRYHGKHLPAARWRDILECFDDTAVREWALGLGVETFVSGGGKVLPTPIGGRMRATPLLRSWIERLRGLAVTIRTGERWSGIDESGRVLVTRDGSTSALPFHATVLAFGGASWPKTGSDGMWTTPLRQLGVELTPLLPANCGWEAEWPTALLEEAEGLPLKNLLVKAGDESKRGELVVTRYGLEGGPIYHLGRVLRAQSDPCITIDFKPDQTRDELRARLGPLKRNFVREARRRLRLDPATGALLKFLPDRGPWKGPAHLVEEIKHCRIQLKGPRPIVEAISSAGGVDWRELDSNLMLRKCPGVFVAGEMIDWEAPTGGYLLQGCLATGTWAGLAAAAW